MSDVKYANTLLQSFDSELIDRLHLKSVALKLGHEIEFPGKPVKHLFFLEEGMASMTTTFKNGTEVEVGMFGYESVIGVSALMGTKQSLNRSPAGDTDAGSRQLRRNSAVAARSSASPCGMFKHSWCNRLSPQAVMRNTAMSKGSRVGF
jgi:CRP-like cAMP-binding protein